MMGVEMDERINKVELRLDKVETALHKQEKQTLTDRFELSSLIKDAVAEGNKETAKLFEKVTNDIRNLEKDMNVLKHAEANRALEQKKNTMNLIRTAIISTVGGWVVLGFLNNYAAITTDRIVKDNEGDIVINDKFY